MPKLEIRLKSSMATKGGLINMAADANPDKRGFKTAALIISVLEEHERCVDRSVDSLAELTEQIVEGFGGLKGKLERVEQSVDAISADIKKLAAYLSKNS